MTNAPTNPCEVCRVRERVGMVFCRVCKASWDRDTRKNGNTTLAVVEWVARRAWRFARCRPTDT
jgi:hypothetical protein